ncbi:MAG: C-terminal helicase domain-containing protein, partial [Candidatus Binatia bacterium]
FDLYNQFSLITRGDRAYFASCGIGDLYRYFLRARRDSRSANGAFALFNLLEEIVIRRTRPFIRKAYPDATIRTQGPDGTWIDLPIHFPDRKLRTVYYNLEAAYQGIYDQVVSGIESLRLAPYNLENYKEAGVQVDEFEAGREEALVGIFKSRYLKRFESSIEAFRISIRRSLAFLKTFESYILGGRVLRSTDFHRILRYLSREDEEDDATPTSMAEEIDANEEARKVLESLEAVDPATYDLRRLHEAVQYDVEVLSNVWQRVKDITPEKDAKLARLKELLLKDLKGKKALIFTYYKDTARYLYRHLGHPENPDAVAFCKKLGGVNIRRMDSGADPKERSRIIQGFAPKANARPEWIGTDREINVLISTDVLSEGQNLQDCGYLLNYDLHWNPTRMVQRAGRIDRIGTDFDILWIYNMFPDEGLERLLGLVESLSLKIADIDQAGFLDASVLGETVHPRDFNTIRRIRDEDGSVIEEEEQFTELASSEFLLQQLRSLIEAGGQEMLESLPDGIHSGLAKEGAKGVFFYFQARPRGQGKFHFWKYYDLRDSSIIDNRYIIANLIACQRDTSRVVDPDMFRSAFDLQEKVIEDILRSVEEQRALEAAPRSVDPIQQTVATIIQSYLNHPGVDRRQAIEAIRFLNQPMLAVQIRKLRQAYREFQVRGDISALLNSVHELRKDFDATQAPPETPRTTTTGPLRREDLRLICLDLVTS